MERRHTEYRASYAYQYSRTSLRSRRNLKFFHCESREVYIIGRIFSAVEETCENVTVIMRNSTLPPFALSQTEPEIPLSRFRRSGSERLRDGAKAFLRRVESLKSRRRKHKHREGVVISEPQVGSLTRSVNVNM